MKKHLMSPLVGVTHRRLGKPILSVTPAGAALILDPEPENPYDPEAIKVSIDIRGIKVSDIFSNEFTGLKDLLNHAVAAGEIDPDEPVVHIGYLPSSGGRFDTLQCGNKEVMAVMKSGPDWSAALEYDPAGKPLVKVEYWED